MSAALRVHSPKLDEGAQTSRQDKKQYLRMKEQAKRVLDHLSQVTEPETMRHVHDAAAVAHESISKLARDNFHGGLKGLYKQYDVDRTGRIDYDDFCNSLFLTNTGIKKSEARLLASEMDKDKTGRLEYSCILDALKEVELASIEKVAQTAKNSADAAPFSSHAAPTTDSKKVKFVSQINSEFDDEKWMQKVERVDRSGASVPAISVSASTSSSTIPAITPQQTISFEEMHNPAYANMSQTPANFRTMPPPPPTAHSSLPLSAPQFKASLSSMLLPPPTEAEIMHSARGRGTYARAVLEDHICHTDGALAPANIPYRRMLQPHHNPNVESTEFSALITDGGMQGRRQSHSPYWTEDSTERQAGRRQFRNARRARASSAPARSLRSKQVGTHYSFFYGNSDDSVALAMSGQESNLSDAAMENYNSSSNVETRGEYQVLSEQSASDEAKTEAQEYREQDSLLNQPSSRYESQQHIDQRLRENAVLTQVGGRFNYLRHVLNATDIGRSGYLNLDEFKSAMARAGVKLPVREMSKVYSEYAKDLYASCSVGHQDGKALPIENFVDKMQELAHDPNKAALPGYNADDSRQTEERRIAKKVLHSLKRVADPMAVFKDLDMTNKGWIRPEQLRQGLTHIGAPLTEMEFKLILEKVDANHDGKIEMQEFDDMLHGALTSDTSSSNSKSASAAKHSHARYTDSYRNKIELGHEGESEFERFLDSKLHQKDRRKWTNLQYVLQNKSTEILTAFTSEDRPWMTGFTGAYGGADHVATKSSTTLREVPIESLTKALSNAGVPLGRDDAQLLVRKIVDSNSEGKISLEDFCKTVNLAVEFTPSSEGGRVGLSAPTDMTHDGGIFSSAKGSHHGDDTVASSMFRNGEEGNIWVKGNIKRKAQTTDPVLAQYPHKWLEMNHSATGDLWPTHPRGDTFYRGKLFVDPKVGGKAVASPTAKSMRRMHDRSKNDSSITHYMGDFSR